VPDPLRFKALGVRHFFSQWFEDDKEEVSSSKDHYLAEIKKQTTSTWWFSDLSATKLPKGTKVYSVDEKGRGMLICGI